MSNPKKPQESDDRYRAPALEKGLDILELLAEHGGGLSQVDIARALDRSPNEIYRMLLTLLRRRYVSRTDNDDLYSLSLRMFSLSQRHPPLSRLIDTALPQMRAVAHKIWQSCHLAMENNGDIVIVASVESPGYWSLALRTGSVMGLGNTGAGRVMAAFRPANEVEMLMQRHPPALGEPAINRPEFLKRLDDIRGQGFESLPSDTAAGVTNIAFPVFDVNGRSIAVVSCPYLERIDDFKVPDILEVQETMRNLASEFTRKYGGAMPNQEART